MIQFTLCASLKDTHAKVTLCLLIHIAYIAYAYRCVNKDCTGCVYSKHINTYSVYTL